MSRVCVGKKFIFPLTFTEWRKQEKNTYVSHSLAKYSQGLEEDSIWCPRKIFSEHPGKCLTSRLFFYEKWVREECDVTPLLDHNLGCWCPQGQLCHVDVLLRILSELKQSIYEEIIVDFPECMNPIKKKLKRTKSTHDHGVPYSPTDAPLHLDVPSQTMDDDDANEEKEEEVVDDANEKKEEDALKNDDLMQNNETPHTTRLNYLATVLKAPTKRRLFQE